MYEQLIVFELNCSYLDFLSNVHACGTAIEQNTQAQNQAQYNGPKRDKK